eukprot:g60169.t1
MQDATTRSFSYTQLLTFDKKEIVEGEDFTWKGDIKTLIAKIKKENSRVDGDIVEFRSRGAKKNKCCSLGCEHGGMQHTKKHSSGEQRNSSSKMFGCNCVINFIKDTKASCQMKTRNGSYTKLKNIRGKSTLYANTLKKRQEEFYLAKNSKRNYMFVKANVIKELEELEKVLASLQANPAPSDELMETVTMNKTDSVSARLMKALRTLALLDPTFVFAADLGAPLKDFDWISKRKLAQGIT